MKLVIIIFISVLFSHSRAVAQEDDSTGVADREVKSSRSEKKPPRGFLGFSAGPAFPVGNFAMDDWDDDKSGFTKNGYQFTAIDFGFKFVPNFGLSFAFKGANVPMEVKKIANFYASEYGGEFTVKSTRWNYGGIYFGPFVSIPSSVVDVDFRFNTGFLLAFSPEIEISRGQEYVRQESAVGPSISITLGARGRFHITRKLGASLGIEYLTARPSFIIDYSSNTQFEQETVYQNITVVNVSAGLLLRIF
jgi:hypothetical protein